VGRRFAARKEDQKMTRASSEPDEVSELTEHKLKHRNLRLEISKLKQSNKLKELEIESKNAIITRLANANNYLSKTVKYEDEK
jgi:hypothetical protein